jgi:hypothetical protein
MSNHDLAVLTMLRGLACCLPFAWGLVVPAAETEGPHGLFLPVDDMNDWVGGLGGGPRQTSL